MQMRQSRSRLMALLLELNTEVLRHNGVSLHQQLVQEASLALCRNRDSERQALPDDG